MNDRIALRVSIATRVLVLLGFACRLTAADDLSKTGDCHPDLASFDRLLTSFVTARNVPGASLAVVKDGRLVVARGYGWADRGRKTPVKPTSLFRVASLSKPLTAVAVLQLVEKRKLRLDSTVFDVVRVKPHLARGAEVDARLRDVTILQLLQHTAGFDRGQSFDPMFRTVQIAETLGVKSPAGPEDVVRYMAGRPLDFDPGRRYAYSNFGYCLLGRVIERVSGLGYERYVKQNVLAPLEICGARLGQTLATQRAPGEVTYYHYRNGTAPAIVGAVGRPVPRPYGAWSLEGMDAHGGWIFSAVDLARFATAFDRPEACKVLKAETIELMFRRPSGKVWIEKDGRPKRAYYGCGWMVRPVGSVGERTKMSTWHSGSFDGTATLLVRRHDGLDWVVLFNTRRGADRKNLSIAIDPLMHGAANAVERWPEIDLFEKYR